MIHRICPKYTWPRRLQGFTLVELMVVVGIVALLITMAATSFGGASRQESVTKSRNQLRDLLLLGRQQACVTGRNHILVCWNVDVETEIGTTTQSSKQGRYALFQYVGPAWSSGSKIFAPFGVQRDRLAVLRKNFRVINMDKPDDTFMRVEASVSDPTQDSTSSEISDSEYNTVAYTYYVGGQKQTAQGGSFKGQTVAVMRSNVGESEPFPLGIRVTPSYSLPQNYSFSSDRAVFAFTPDGIVDTSVKGAVNKISASSSVSNNMPTFSVSINSDGTVEVGE